MLDSLVQVYFGTAMFIEVNKYTKCLNTALAIARLDRNVPMMNKLDYIRKNTNKEMEIPLITLEHINEKSKLKPLDTSFEFQDREISLNEIKIALNDVWIEITYIVSEIAEKNEVSFSFDLSKYKVKGK